MASLSSYWCHYYSALEDIREVKMTSPSDAFAPRPHSPEQQATPLESLVSHLLASKRSLSSVNHVLRANELVTSTRKSLETNVITTARSGFLRSGIDEQVKVLEHVRTGSESVARHGNAEFAAFLKTLDEAEQRLKGTLQTLRETFVEAGLRPEGEEKKSLLDFVDESGVETVLDTINQSIGNAGTQHKDFAKTNEQFAEEVLGVRQLMLEHRSRLFEDSAENVEANSPLPEILTNMEGNAREMANNLESLVKHYDLCVSAVKHTEGGGDAAQRIAGSLPEGVDVGESDLNASPEPISEDERQDMINIIEKDASEVEEVVTEIRERIAEMEGQEQILMRYIDACTQEHINTNTAFKLLKGIGHRLPAFIGQSQDFLMRWEEEKLRLAEHMEELEALREFYDGFLIAYDNLLIEIGRRGELEAKVDIIIQDAMSKVNRLYKDDSEARETFKAEQGEFLPVDIWPGMTSSAVQYVIAPVGDSMGRVPEVPRIVIEQAKDRVSRRL